MNIPTNTNWQGNLRPEDAGRSDGERGYPAAGDPASDFEHQIRERFENFTQQLSQAYAQVEADLGRQYQTLEPQAKAAWDALQKLRAGIGHRELEIALSHRLAVTAGVALGALSTVIAAIAMPSGVGDRWIGIVIASAIAVILALCAHFGGLIVRQAKRPPQLRFGLAMGVVSALTFGLLVAAQDHSNWSPMQRFGLGIACALAMLAIAALAYLSHDEVAAYEELTAKHLALSTDLARVVAARNGARERFEAQALAARDHAQELIRAYRHHNRINRNGQAVPGFFDAEPAINLALGDLFPFQCPNTP